MTRGFQIHPADNVATLLADTAPGRVRVIGAVEREVKANAVIKLGHKVALVELKPGDAVIKYGVRIGHASQEISPGDWVHLHNLASDLDERSSTLDGETGAPTDTKYE